MMCCLFILPKQYVSAFLKFPSFFLQTRHFVVLWWIFVVPFFSTKTQACFSALSLFRSVVSRSSLTVIRILTPFSPLVNRKVKNFFICFFYQKQDVVHDIFLTLAKSQQASSKNRISTRYFTSIFRHFDNPFTNPFPSVPFHAHPSPKGPSPKDNRHTILRASCRPSGSVPLESPTTK